MSLFAAKSHHMVSEPRLLMSSLQDDPMGEMGFFNPDLPPVFDKYHEEDDTLVMNQAVQESGDTVLTVHNVPEVRPVHDEYKGEFEQPEVVINCPNLEIDCLIEFPSYLINKEKLGTVLKAQGSHENKAGFALESRSNKEMKGIGEKREACRDTPEQDDSLKFVLKRLNKEYPFDDVVQTMIDVGCCIYGDHHLAQDCPLNWVIPSPRICDEEWRLSEAWPHTPWIGLNPYAKGNRSEAVSHSMQRSKVSSVGSNGVLVDVGLNDTAQSNLEGPELLSRGMLKRRPKVRFKRVTNKRRKHRELRTILFKGRGNDTSRDAVSRTDLVVLNTS